jgi:hypothetical protein
MKYLFPLVGKWLMVLILCLAGCESQSNRQLRELRQQFVVSQEPSAPTSIEGAKKEIETQPMVTVVGRINAGKSDPLQANQATIVIGELPDPSHNHAADDDCPFCKRRLEESEHCIVRFVDASGNVIPLGAAEIFGVKPNQDVIVRGKGKLLPEVDIFQIDADSIFVRPLVSAKK